MAPTNRQQQITVVNNDDEDADIFAESKILVAIVPNLTSATNHHTMAYQEEKDGNHRSNSVRMVVKYACGGFRQSFGYDGASTIPFSALLGAATNMETLSRIEDCIIFNRRTLNVYMNLYTSAGNGLSCHLSILTVRGDPQQQQQQPPPSAQAPSSDNNMNGGLDSFNLDGSFGSVKAVVPPEKMAVISIRSSAVVGHAKISAMGYVFFCMHMYQFHLYSSSSI